MYNQLLLLGILFCCSAYGMNDAGDSLKRSPSASFSLAVSGYSPLWKKVVASGIANPSDVAAIDQKYESSTSPRLLNDWGKSYWQNGHLERAEKFFFLAEVAGLSGSTTEFDPKASYSAFRFLSGANTIGASELVKEKATLWLTTACQKNDAYALLYQGYLSLQRKEMGQAKFYLIMAKQYSLPESDISKDAVNRLTELENLRKNKQS